MEERLVSFRPRAIVVALGILLTFSALLTFVYLAWHVITWILIALFLALALNPAVEFFERRGLRRGWASAVVFFLALLSFVALGFLLVPPLVDQVRQFIDAVLKAGGVQVEPSEDPRFAAADEALMVGDLDAAERAFKKILGETPNDSAAEAGLAQVGLMRRVTDVDPVKAITAAAEAPDDVAAQTLAADVEMLSGRADAAYQRLVDVVRRTSGDERETARKHLVSLFTIAGPDDPAVASARRALANALF